MNFLLFLSVFVVISLEPRATAKDFFHSRKNSIKELPADETKRKQGENSGVSIIKGWAQTVPKAVRSWTQRLRRLLKILRKWCHSHPPEVKLGKCFTKYLSADVFGIKQFNVVENLKDESNVMKYQHKTSKARKNKWQIIKRDYESQKSASGGNSTWNKIVFSALDFIQKTKNRFLHYRSNIFGNEFAVCLWEYFVKKFWTWVDSAPDPAYSFNNFN